MSNFNKFKTAMQRQFATMAQFPLFTVESLTGPLTRDHLWEHYLGSFPEGTNLIYQERTEHDCQCCKQFIRKAAAVVAIVDNELVSIWDNLEGIPSPYKEVAAELSTLVKANAISDVFLHYENVLGTDYNFQDMGDSDPLKWEHFYFELPSRFVARKDSIPTKLGKHRSNKDVLKRGLTELSIEAIDTVLELIEQGSLYRGEEHKQAVSRFRIAKVGFNKITDAGQRDNYCWKVSIADHKVTGFRNSAIGTLVVDLSDGEPLTDAVKMFESKVAPQNYKRPTALITKAMITKAQEKVAELGILDSLERRHSTAEDITINDVIYADKSVKPAMGIFEELADEVVPDLKSYDNVEEVSIDTFINNIVPKATSLELMFDNKHTGNLVSLISPVHSDAPAILKWGNNFSWSYNGEVTDSMRERVSAAGGRVGGALRFTHSWNHTGKNQSLMDLHVFMPGNEHTYKKKQHDHYGTDHRVGWNHRQEPKSGGVQDVDFVDRPGKAIPLENISFEKLSKMPEGIYQFKIHNWGARTPNETGFKAEIEFGNELYQYEYTKHLKNKEWVSVAEAVLEGGEFTIKHLLQESNSSKTVWNIPTQKFHKVTMVMNSPNHWDNSDHTGNKHWFFVLENCLSEGTSRGLYNEFLKGELHEHRKVFEVLGAKMRVAESGVQLSGLGFSETVKASVLCKVEGSFSRIIKINF